MMLMMMMIMVVVFLDPASASLPLVYRYHDVNPNPANHQGRFSMMQRFDSLGSVSVLLGFPKDGRTCGRSQTWDCTRWMGAIPVVRV